MREQRNTLGKRIAIIVSLLIMTLCSIVISSMFEQRQVETIAMQGEGTLNQMYVTHITSGLTSQNKEERVNWWQNPNDGIYYLFLPSSANTKKLRIGMEGTNQITIDGDRVENNDKYSLAEGLHTITDSTATYQLQVVKSSKVATLFLNTASGNMDYLKEDKLHCESGSTLILSPKGDIEYAGMIEKVHGRGNSTWYDGTKLPYTIKLTRKTNLFGMGKSRTWVLLANESDRTMLRNYTVHDMARESGMPFTAQSVFVDFYTNGDYQGTYQLCEQVEVAPNRVEIPNLEDKTQNVNPSKALNVFPMFGGTEEIEDTEPGSTRGYEIEKDPADITGGYLLTMNIGYSYLDHINSGFVTERNQAVDIESPAYASREQVAYISNLYQQFEDAMYDWDGINQETQLHYYDYMDVDSFAKKYLVEEISKNLDASIASQYMYKYPDDISTKFYAGPVWDYDKSLGNGGVDGYNSCDLTDPEGFYATEDVTGHTIWYAVFFRPEFHASVLENYYGNFREHALQEVDTKIDYWAEEIKGSVIMNAIRWGQYGSVENEEIQTGYDAEIDNLKDFITRRIAFLDSQWQEE